MVTPACNVFFLPRERYTFPGYAVSVFNLSLYKIHFSFSFSFIHHSAIRCDLTHMQTYTFIKPIGIIDYEYRKFVTWINTWNTFYSGKKSRIYAISKLFFHCKLTQGEITDKKQP